MYKKEDKLKQGQIKPGNIKLRLKKHVQSVKNPLFAYSYEPNNRSGQHSKPFIEFNH